MGTCGRSETFLRRVFYALYQVVLNRRNVILDVRNPFRVCLESDPGRCRIPCVAAMILSQPFSNTQTSVDE